MWAILWVATLGVMSAQSRHPAYIRYGVNEGLPNQELYCVMRDREGFIWFGSDAGVARFDGHHMRVFDSRDGLPDRAVLQIQQDRQGRIWFFMPSGYLSYYFNGHFYNSDNDSTLAALACRNTIISYYEHSNGDLYFGSMGGEIKCLHPNGKVEPIYPVSHPRWVVAFSEHKGLPVAGSLATGYIAVDTVQGMHGILCEPTSAFVSAVTNFPLKGLFHSNGDFWITFGLHVLIIRPDAPTRYYYGKLPGLTSGRIVYLGETKEGYIWIGTSKGAYLYASSHLELGPIKHVLPKDEVRYVMEDGDNGTWFATTLGAVYMPDQGIRIAFHPDYLGQDLAIRGLDRTANGNYIAAVYPLGFYLLDRRLSRLHVWETDPDSMFRLPLAVFALDSVTTYVTTVSQTMIVSPPKLEPIQALVYADYENYKDSLCLCTSYGWYLVDPSRHQTHLWGSKELPIRTSRQPERCYEAETDRQGRLWIANTRGLSYYRDGVLNEVEAARPYLRGKILDLVADPVRGVWVGTVAHGLLYIDGDTVVQFNEPSGLVDIQVNSIDIGSGGDVWAGTPRGVSRVQFDRKRKASKIDNLYSGGSLPNKPISKVLVEGDSVLVVMNNEVLIFSQRLFDAAISAPIPKLLSLSIMGRDTLPVDGLRLDYGDNNLLFRFTAIGFRGGQKIEYRFRLRGDQEPWTIIKGEEISFVSLPPGEYAFELQAKTPGTPWSAQAAVLRFEISKPYWQKAWFILLLILTILGTILLIVIWIFYQAKRRNERRQRLVQAEHRALVTQMNPHFISNSLQSIQSYFINRDLETANDYMADFSELMRSILDSSRSSSTTLQSELRMIRLYLQMEQMRTSDGFEFQITVDPAIQPERFTLPPLLLQPFLENAIWHGIVPKGKQGKVDIYIEPVEGGIQIVLNDDGIGRTQSLAAKAKLIKTRKSHATDIVRERIDLLNQHYKNQFKFWIVDRVDPEGQPAGTTVIFILPTNFKEPHDQNHPD